jgi:intraflagellar transport protein 88
MKNIGHAFVRLGQYQDAMQSYDTVMEGAPDVVTGYNLVVCFHALGDKEKMKKSFTRLLSTTPPDAADEDDADFSADDAGDDGCAY